jgi:hypothetical protein
MHQKETIPRKSFEIKKNGCILPLEMTIMNMFVLVLQAREMNK